jgi:ABC-2 type transport system ATP-binding protein
MIEMALTADHVVNVARGQLVKETPMEALTRHGSLEDAYLELTSGRGL